jgi:molybdenum cofactor cytidylyltransferase
MNAGNFAVILAAGASHRMGREKARLPWLEGKTLLRWMVDALIAAGWQPRAVLGPGQFDDWSAELPAGCAVLNPDPARGKTSSLAAGVQSVPTEARRILITAVDQPRPPALYERLRREADGWRDSILLPDHNGRRGHPVVVPGAAREELLALDEHSLGLRGWLDAHRAETLHLPGCDPLWLKWDLNTPDAYEEALSAFRRGFPSIAARGHGLDSEAGDRR